MPNDGNKMLRFAGQLIAVSAKAWLVNIADEEHWLPKSVCELDDPAADTGDTVSGTIPEWLVSKKGIDLDGVVPADGGFSLDDEMPF